MKRIGDILFLGDGDFGPDGRWLKDANVDLALISEARVVIDLANVQKISVLKNAYGTTGTAMISSEGE